MYKLHVFASSESIQIFQIKKTGCRKGPNLKTKLSFQTVIKMLLQMQNTRKIKISYVYRVLKTQND